MEGAWMLCGEEKNCYFRILFVLMMERKKGYSLFFIFSSILLILSACSRDTGTNNNGSGTGNGGGSGTNPPAPTGCKACEYYTICDGSYFTYIDSVYPAAPVTYTDTLRAQADTTINGLLYKRVKIISTRYPSTESLNCKDGIYRVAGKYGFSSKPIILLKANDPVGTSWTESPSTGVNVTFTNQAKGLTVRINGRDYTDVIQVRAAISGFGSQYTADYYFAKGIGIIKYEYGQWNSDPNWYHRNNLQSFFIP